MVLSFAGCTIGGEPKHPAWKSATGAEQYERLMWQAIRDKDWKNVEYHLAPTFVGVDANGKAFDRAAWVEHWKSAPVQEFSFGEVSVQPEGPNMVVSYILHVSETQGTPGDGLRVLSVWQQVKRGWILTATSTTPVVAHP
jgi:hypothetical protein